MSATAPTAPTTPTPETKTESKRTPVERISDVALTALLKTRKARIFMDVVKSKKKDASDLYSQEFQWTDTHEPILAKEGVIGWVFASLGIEPVLEAILSIPMIGGSSLSFSRLGTFIVFVYIWVPFMILPIQAAIERIPRSLLEASADLGGHPSQTFRKVIFPLALPGIAAGSIFTFSLTLGDYIIPGVIGNSTLYIGQVVYMHQGMAGNLPFAAAFSLVPIVVIAVYLTLAKRMGAFDAL